MFIQKNTAELIELTEKIKIVGLSFQKCKETGSVKLESPMELYENLELQAGIRHLVQPQTGYAVWANADKDVIFGKGVTDLSDQDELYGSYIIPAGRYLKVSWNAETFEGLVMEGMEDWNFWKRAETDAFLEKNGLIADHTLDIEVYPHEKMRVGYENGPDWGPRFMSALLADPVTEYPEMYYLFSVRNK